MPRLVITEGAARGLERCRRALAEKSPHAARRAAQAIIKQFDLVEAQPEIGRPFLEAPDLRELIVPFGDSGYVALYRYDPDGDAVYVLAFRHQREAGY